MIPTLMHLLLYAVLLWCVATDLASAENRLAFLVGIDKYDNLPAYRQLTRAVKDARAMSAVFEEAGFKPYVWENQSRSSFNAKWQDFIEKIQSDDTVAIFLSGHGIEIEGENFLLPGDIPYIRYGRQEQIKRESISISQLLLDLRTTRKSPKVTILILDACRENPLIPPEFKGVDGSKGGLARMEPPEGTFIMYSAAATETALERLPVNDTDENSVYVRSLLPLLRIPDFSLPDLSQELRRRVRALTKPIGHIQRPAYYDGLIGRFCLAGCRSEDTLRQREKPYEGGLMLPRDARQAWTWIANTESEEALASFAQAYKDTRYSELALSRLDSLMASKGNLHVVSIGIDRYQSREFPDLAFSEDDAQSVGRLLMEEMGVLYAGVERHILVGHDATRESILESLDQIRRKARPNDTTILYITGHAFPKGDKLYFAPFDAEVDRFATFIDFADIQGELAAMLGRRALFFDSTGLPLDTGIGENLLRDLRAEQVAVLLAASPGQQAFEIMELGHSAFADSLIRGLSGEADLNASGSIYFSELSQYVANEVPRLLAMTSESLKLAQQPIYFLGEKDFLLKPSL